MIEEANNSVSVNEQSNELALPDTTKLNEESLSLVNQIIAEQDAEKTKDLTYLFNQNQNKKTIVRQNKLNDLQDLLVDQTMERIKKRPDELSNTDLLTSLKTVQDMLERGQKQVNGANDPQPLIQINQQNNEVNVGAEKNLTKESRDKVKKAILAILGNANFEQSGQELTDVIETSEDADGNK